MVMDVFGKKPRSECGEYFRASVWHWRPIHKKLCELCSDIFSDRQLRRLGNNDGESLDTQEDCNIVARRFAVY